YFNIEYTKSKLFILPIGLEEVYALCFTHTYSAHGCFIHIFYEVMYEDVEAYMYAKGYFDYIANSLNLVNVKSIEEFCNNCKESSTCIAEFE
ncbi:hypothetical protein NL492_26470, partial [Klebsiella pneumoniae]|nr:hypothetical protein [Klebsiella pneumoniae]